MTLISRARRPLLCLAGFAALAACEAKPKPVSIAAEAAQRDESGSLLVTWTASDAKAPIDVFLLQPGGAKTLVSDDDKDGAYVLTAEQAAQRPLIELVSQSGSERTVAERLLPLEGGRNFRDLGGYKTADGKSVRWGMLFRSGTMTNLTPHDSALLNTLGIKTICDFRETKERKAEPTNAAAINSDLVYQTRDYVSDTSAFANILKKGDKLTPQDVADTLQAYYRNIPYEHADSYRTMFRDIVDGRLPLAFNCSAGKDRTGVGAALVLSALGVPRETVLQDYALSEKVVNYEKVLAPTIASGKSKPVTKQSGFGELVAKMTPEQRAPLLRSDPVYLSAALDEITRKEGSLDNYFTKVLGLSAADLTTIRSRLLEPNI